MRNTLEDLNNHLFMQLERLGDEELTDEQLEREVRRTEAITKIATNIVENGTLVLKVWENASFVDRKTPAMLIGNKDGKN